VDDNGRPLPRLALRPNATVVLLDDGAGDGKSQP